jgi:hypothetical protein
MSIRTLLWRFSVTIIFKEILKFKILFTSIKPDHKNKKSCYVAETPSPCSGFFILLTRLYKHLRHLGHKDILDLAQILQSSCVTKF